MLKKIFFFFFFSHLIFGQIPKSKDSLQIYLNTQAKDTLYIQALNDFAFINIQEGDYDKAEQMISQMEQLSQKLKYKTGFYKVANMKGVIEFSKQKPENALLYFQQCSEIIKKYKLEKKYYQNVLNNILIIYDQLGDRENATKYAMELIHFQEKNKLHPLKTSPYDQIGKNLKFYKKYDEALVYFSKSLLIETQNKNLSGMAISENNIATLYEDMDENTDAISHLKKGLQYAQKIDYKLLQTDLLTNLGRLFQKQNNDKEAEKYLLKSEKLCRELDAKSSLKIVCQNLGDLYQKKGKEQLALKYYNEALRISKTTSDPQLSYSINDVLAKLYANKNDFKSAYQFQQASISAKDSLFEIRTQENTENLLRKYEAEKKQQEIKTLIAEKNVQKLQIEVAEKNKKYFIIGSLLLAIIGGMFFYQGRNRKIANKKLQILNTELDKANKNKALFLGILNHDLRSPVASLVNFLKIQKNSPELMDEETRKRLNLQATTSAEKLLKNMEDLLLWSKSQMEKFEVQRKIFAVSELFSDLKNEFSWVEETIIHFQNPENLELNSDKEFLKTILRNLIANSAKILTDKTNGKIVCAAKSTGNTVEISIKDNGGGSDLEKFSALYNDQGKIGIKNGLGLHVIRDLCKAINAEIKVNSDKIIGETEVVVYMRKI